MVKARQRCDRPHTRRKMIGNVRQLLVDKNLPGNTLCKHCANIVQLSFVCKNDYVYTAHAASVATSTLLEPLRQSAGCSGSHHTAMVLRSIPQECSLGVKHVLFQPKFILEPRAQAKEKQCRAARNQFIWTSDHQTPICMKVGHTHT